MFSVEAARLIHALAEGPASPAPSSDNTTVVAALIGGVVAVAVALITGYFGTRGERPRRRPSPAMNETSRREAELTQEAAIAENDRRDAERREAIATEKCQVQSARIEVLERALILRGFAPWKFTQGDESDADTRITAR